MAYVAVKGGRTSDPQRARLARRGTPGGDPSVLGLSLDQIREQLGRAGGLRDGAGAWRTIPIWRRWRSSRRRKYPTEAAFLLRAYRTTLPRGSHMPRRSTWRRCELRGAFRQSSRICRAGRHSVPPTITRTDCWTSNSRRTGNRRRMPRVPRRTSSPIPRVPDIPRPRRPAGTGWSGRCRTRRPDPRTGFFGFPAGRDVRLRWHRGAATKGFLLAMGYSTQRGYGGSHPFAGEVRMGEVSVEIEPPELGFAIDIGDLTVTECQMVNQFKGSKTTPPQFTRGYGLVFGFSERKAMSMALVDRAMRAAELGEDVTAPAQNPEFVLYHSDNIEATGFVEHLKLPHYALISKANSQNVRRLREAVERREAAE